MTDYLDRHVDLNDPAIASLIDELSLWSSRFGALLCDNIEFESDLCALDVACGTGFPLFELAHSHGPSCRFFGVDLWENGIARAARKLRQYEIDHVKLVRADGARLPFPDSSIDLVTSNLGINNFEDAPGAFRECARVLRPGARIVLTTNVTGHMREFYETFREVLGRFELEESVRRLNEQEAHRSSKEALIEMLGEAGFRVERAIEDEFQLRYLNGHALLRHSLVWIGFLEGWRGVLDPGDEHRVFTELERQLDEAAKEKGGLRMTVPMLYLEARTP